MLPMMIDVLLLPSLRGGLPSPLWHGQNGILDEVLLFTAPIIVTLTILVISSRRGRGNQERTRIRTARSTTSEAVEASDTGTPVEDEHGDAPR